MLASPRRKGAALALGLFAGAALVALPALGQNQEAPESLLPPGFDESPPAPVPAPAPEPVAPRPVTPTPSPAETPLSVARDDDETQLSDEDEGSIDELATDDERQQRVAESDLPSQARRNLREIGVITPSEGGFSSASGARAKGPYWKALVAAIDRPIISRWGSIMLRRALASRTLTPSGVNGADWVAERAALLLRMGEADAARMLIQEVDPPDYTRRLQDVAMDTYLATADPAGWCPIIGRGVQDTEDPRWELARAVCAGLSGEQSAATAQIDRASREGIAPGIDLLLAEKVIGAGVGGRRAVTIEWDGIDVLTEWRFGLSLATGIEPPVALIREADRRFHAWRTRAPMLPLASRVEAADVGGGMGVMSNTAMVDLYSAAYDSPLVDDSLRARGALLRAAYVQQEMVARLDAMQDIWNRPQDSLGRYASLVLTARAAALFPVSEQSDQTAASLIASMLTAGLDRNAMRWRDAVEPGGQAWALLALADPENGTVVDGGDLDRFIDGDPSEKARKSRFFVAGLAGLGRIDADTAADYADDLSFDLTRETRWTRAMRSAVAADQPLLVAILAGAGMQGTDWSRMTALHLFHIVDGLRRVGLDAEARMIAAEAIVRV